MDEMQYQYLTVEILTRTSGVVINKKLDYHPQIYCSVNGGEWEDCYDWSVWHISGVVNPWEGGKRTVNVGDIIRFKGVNNAIDMQPLFSVDHGRHYVYGNIMSLLYGDDFADKTEFPVDPFNGKPYKNIFKGLFGGYMLSGPNKIYIPPISVLGESCFESMFAGEEYLTTLPINELPSAVLAKNCYSGMFSYCKSLTEAPFLNVSSTDPDNNGGECSYMFDTCSALTSISAIISIPTITEGMFANFCIRCSSLSDLSNVIITSKKVTNVLSGDGLGSFSDAFRFCGSINESLDISSIEEIDGPSVGGDTDISGAFQGMYYGCTNLERHRGSINILHIKPGTFTFAFAYCLNLKYIKCLSLDGYCIESQDPYVTLSGGTVEWVEYGVPSGGLFIKNKDADDWMINSPHGIPSGWTVKNASSVVINPSEIIANSASTSISISIYSEVNGTVSVPEWASISDTYVSGGTINYYTITISTNNDLSRNGYITVKNLSNETIGEGLIYQYGRISLNDIVLLPSSVYFEGLGGEELISVISVNGWYSEKVPSWIHILPDHNNTPNEAAYVLVSAEPNPYDEERTAFIPFKDKGGIVKYLTVTQHGKWYYKDVTGTTQIENGVNNWLLANYGATKATIDGVSYDWLNCGDYAIYYENRLGGYDSFLFEGSCKMKMDIERLTYRNKETGTINYRNVIVPEWELNTGRLSDDEVKRFVNNVLPSKKVYLHRLDTDEVFPVYITDNVKDVKDFKSNAKARVVITLNVRGSQETVNIY